jgi:glycosyltransferase involved in cell wall biosynthesis
VTPSAGVLVRHWGSYFKSEREAHRIASYFSAVRAAGWTCHLVCCRPPELPDWLGPIDAAGITVHYLPRARGNFDRHLARVTASLCRATHADVFHCDNTHTSPLIGAWMARVPVRLWSKHAMEPAFEAGRVPTVRDRLAPSLWLSCALATRVLPISRAIERELVERGIGRGKLEVVPLPIAPAGATPARPARADGEVVFGTIGRAVPVKGWDLLIQAFAAVARDLPGARLRLVGSTGAPDERAHFDVLQQIVREAGLEGRVTFAGHSTNVPSELAGFDAFVLPSRSEGYSLAVIEALQAGLPVISTKVGIAPEIITADNGLLVERDDVEGLARALRAVGGDAGVRLRHAAGARPGVPGVPTAEEHAAALRDLYESLLSARGGPRAATHVSR